MAMAMAFRHATITSTVFIFLNSDLNEPYLQSRYLNLTHVVSKHMLFLKSMLLYVTDD